MTDIIKLDRSAGDEFKRLLKKMQNGMADTDDDLRSAESSAGGLTYASMKSSITQTRSKFADNAKRLREFERAYDEYVHEIEQFDRRAAGLLQNMPLIIEWSGHSGWTADPAIVALNLMEKLVRDGVVKDLDSARAFLLDYAATLAGQVKTCAFCGDPVNMSTGNFIYSKEDLSIPGAFPLVFKRFYNSLDENSSVLGQKWTHSFNIMLEDRGDDAKIVFEDGHAEFYEKSGKYAYTSPSGKFSVLTKNEAGFTLTTVENHSYHFNSDGQLLSISDLNGNETVFTYEGSLLTEVGNASGKLAFAYTPEGLLCEVKDHTGRQVSFSYKDECLKEVQQPGGAVYRYKYDEKKNLVKIINPADIAVIANSYDKDGRNTKQRFADGGQLSFFYEDELLTTTATEQNGNTVKYVRDSNHRTVRIEYEGSEERFEYNDDNLRTMHKDRNGNIRRYEYDERGNLTQAINPLEETGTTEYNDFNKPVRISICGELMLQTGYDACGNATGIKDALGRESKVGYNNGGRPVKITLPDGSVIDIEYDARGNILTICEPCSTAKYEYDGLNRVIAAIDGNGNKTRFEYNAKGDITKVINASGHERSYEYNASGKVTRITDFDGSVLSREYNDLGKPSRLVDQEGNETRLEYDLMWNVSKQIDANGAQTVFKYNKLNRLEKVTDATGNSIRYTYDANGNRVSVTGPQGNLTMLSYDALDRVVEVTEPDGAKTAVEYDRMGQISKTVDALGHVSNFSYDNAGQKISATDPSGRELKYSYNLLGQISEIKDSAGRATKYEYLPGGLLKKVLYPDGRSAEYEYDANRNVVSQTSQDGYILYYEYDCLNQITKISSNRGQEKRYVYDAVGNVTAMTDACGHTTKYAYSPSGNLIAVTDPLGNKSEYDYDKLGNLIEVKQLAELKEAQKINEQNSQLRVTRYEHNKLGQVERIVDALGHAEEYTYDKAGNLLSKLDKEGYLTKYTYSATNLLEEIRYADGKSVKLSYNQLKQLTEIKDWLGLTAVEVDELGRARKVTDYRGKEVEYTYGPAGERTGVKYPDGKVVEYRYDEALRLKTLVDGDNLINYTYDENSRLSDKIFASGIKTQYSYNDLGLLSELVHSDQEGILDKYIYSYDSMLNKTGIEKHRRGMEEESGKYQYTYDALSRLSGVSKNDTPIKAFGYDAFGNRSYMEDKGERTQYAYNPLNQLLHLENAKHSQDFCYDARGNLTQILENGQLKHSYEFSPLNRLTKAANATEQVASYDYNGLGFRVGKQVMDDLNPTKSINYVLDLTKQYHNLLQLTEDGQSKNYAWDVNVVSESGDAGSRFYLQDDLGSPLRFTAADGSLVDSYSYDEFGNDLIGNQGKLQPFGFTGYQYDSVAQTYFAQAREYDPLLGRFTAQDRIKGIVNEPITLHPYCYCQENPIRYIDPDGNYTEKEGNEAHAVLQGIVKLIYGDNASVEYEVSPYPYSPTGVGFADIVIWAKIGAEVYEIKPITQRGKTKAELGHIPGTQQRQGYIDALNDMGYKINETGVSFNPNYWTIPSPTNPQVKIRYYTFLDEPGMIYWGHVKNPEKDRKIPFVFEDYNDKDQEGRLLYFDRVLNPDYNPNVADEQKVAFDWNRVGEFGLGVLLVIGCGALIADNFVGGYGDDYVIPLWWDRAMQGFSFAFGLAY